MAKAQTKNRVQDRLFEVTDVSMWETNKEDGAFYPHAVEVVDTVTGKKRYLEVGSVIKLISGKFTTRRERESAKR